MRKLILGTGASLLAASIASPALALPVSAAGKVTLTEGGEAELAAKRGGPKVKIKEDTGRTAGAGTDIKATEIKGDAIKHSDIKGAELKHSDIKATELKHSEIKAADIKHSDMKHSDMKQSEHKEAVPKPVEQRIK